MYLRKAPPADRRWFARSGLSAEQLAVLAKGDPRKARLARRVKTTTLAPLPRLAEGLQNGGRLLTRVAV